MLVLLRAEHSRASRSLHFPTTSWIFYNCFPSGSWFSLCSSNTNNSCWEASCPRILKVHYYSTHRPIPGYLTMGFSFGQTSRQGGEKEWSGRVWPTSQALIRSQMGKQAREQVWNEKGNVEYITTVSLRRRISFMTHLTRCSMAQTPVFSPSSSPKVCTCNRLFVLFVHNTISPAADLIA